MLNTDCRAHEVDNLYVVDTSFFPSIGAVNPALTAMANALRVGDHLLERLDARQPEPSPRMSHNGARAPAPRGDRRRRVRRDGGGATAEEGRCRRDGGRPPQPPSVSAADLPGGRRRAVLGEVAAPQRHMLKRQANATVLMAAVTDLDVEHRQVCSTAANASTTTA